MNHFPEAWGRPRNDVYGQNSPSNLLAPIQHTQRPSVTGTSVLGLMFKDGVVLAADNLASYGSLARFEDVERLIPFGKDVVIGAGGDISDLQYIKEMLERLSIKEDYLADGHHLRAPNVYEYLSRVMYKRRTDMNPLWNFLVVGGLDDEGNPFLSYADLLGTTFTAPHLSTGMGSAIAIPIMRRRAPSPSNVSLEEAKDIIAECMRVLFYRDARSSRKYTLATITRQKVQAEIVKVPGDEAMEGGQTAGHVGKTVDRAAVGARTLERLETTGESWKFADSVRGYGAQTV